MVKRRILLIAAFAALQGIPGCAKMSFPRLFGSRSPDGASGFANQASTPANGIAQGTDPSTSSVNGWSSGAGNPSNSFAATSGRNMAQTLRNAGGAVSNALTIKSKVIPADDPISLATKPGKMGPELYLEAAKLAESSGNLDGAIQQYKRAIAAAPGQPSAYVSLGRVHDRLGNVDEAVRQYRRAIQLDDKNSVAYNDLGLCLARHGNSAAAVAELQKAVTLQPDKALYRNNLATVLTQLGRNDEALAQLSATYSPAIAHYNLGHLLQTKGDLGLAQEQFRQAVELAPELAPAQKMLSRVETLMASSSKPESSSQTEREGTAPVVNTPASALPAIIRERNPRAEPLPRGNGEWAPSGVKEVVERSREFFDRQAPPPDEVPLPDVPALLERTPSDSSPSDERPADHARTGSKAIEEKRVEQPPVEVPTTIDPAAAKLPPVDAFVPAEPPARPEGMPEIRYPDTGFPLPSLQGPVPPAPDEYRSARGPLRPTAARLQPPVLLRN